MKLTRVQIDKIAATIKANPAAFRSFLEAESNSQGFSEITGKIIIQFEPSYFKKTYKDWQKSDKNSVWLNNPVGNQTVEWKAFNDAYKLSPAAAMKSTSIGAGQVMGYHYARLGFKTVNEMWDFAKGWDGKTYSNDRGEYNQVVLIALFIKTDPRLLKIMQKPELTLSDFDLIAKYYNGLYYKELAIKLDREPYDKTMFKYYNHFKAAA
ncbi:hypothetical protein N180_02705 [Pedobacter antarcticus 4BY]|uniref:N-acetylmuramidase domain-containing protein n=2 Tax=Pedobacter antarcticus TaxID=34086 RepID=A0A081PKF2_9SPHI|nr:N-acetylmuramidase domain-containing protein [Pedobacter antarcticus]KEQ31175.1 hypothetical protein N180_02705 [Pedobacter antarcticus 4BY]SFE54079.1 Protein of unknown function [Pedobacter antarcticus]